MRCEPQMVTYFGLLRRGTVGKWAVDFPDFPDFRVLVTQFDDAYPAAAQAVNDRINRLRTSAKPLPTPTDRETLEEDPVAREAMLLRVEIDDRAEMGDRA